MLRMRKISIRLWLSVVAVALLAAILLLPGISRALSGPAPDARAQAAPAHLPQRAIAGVNWGNAFGLLQSNARAIDGLLVLYLGMMVSSFSHHIFTSKQVDLELISAALCLYLLLAMLWASLFTLLEGFMPGSFAGSGLAQAETLREYHQYFNYFSFVTITTLGYGDITPQTPLAMTLCQVEAILGQFFIAVLVARLVGIQIAQSFTERKQ